MLTSLHIQNYALISELQLTLDGGFTVITGETGAGKSILLGALGLIMGQRADSHAITTGEQKCVVEACFSIADYRLQDWFQSEDLDYDDTCLVRREVLASGKSRAFINDTPVTLQQLRDLTSRLIDIHSQHENLLLQDNDFQLRMLDALAHNSHARDAYTHAYTNYKDCEQRLSELRGQAHQATADADYIRFQFQQLDEAHLQADELPALEQELERLNHTEVIKTALMQVSEGLNNEESSLLQRLKTLSQTLQSITSYVPEAQDMAERLQSAHIELDDLVQTAEQLNERQEFDPQRLQLLTERYDQLNSLLLKFHAADEEELIQKRDALDKQLQHIDNFDEELAALEKELHSRKKALDEAGHMLSQSRQDVTGGLEQRLVSMLVGLGIQHPQFQVQLTATEACPQGMDSVQFLLAANKNQALQPMALVASGGEISRVMLCLKALLAESQQLPTLLLDEIDTGVSGHVADRMGSLMQEMGQRMQLLTITHLPQIAARGGAHFYVYKEDNERRTETHIRQLSHTERVAEIAKMMSGSSVSEEAQKAAEKLLCNH